MSGPSRSVLVVVGIATAALAWFLWSDPGDIAPVVTQHDPEQGEAPIAEPREAAHREAMPAAPEAPASEPTAEEQPQLFTVRGRVLDIGGAPLAGVAVLADGTDILGRSDAIGRYEVSLSIEPNGIYLVAEDEGWSPVRQSLVTLANHQSEHLLVSARAFDLGGTVVDTAGTPLKGAVVAIELSSETLRDFPFPLDMARPTRCSTITGDHGRFALAAAPCPAGTTIVARENGYAPGRVAAPAHSSQDLYIVLTAEEAGSKISGIVLRHDHRPAEGAKVQFGFGSAVSDATGAFALPLPSNVEADQPLVAGMDGHGLALVPSFGELVLAARPSPPAPVTLVLAANPKDLVGRVIDESGQGLTDWIVSIAKGTEITRHSTPPELAEGFGGGSIRDVTDENGGFRLSNLLARDYIVRAYHPRTLLTILSDPVAAGTEDLQLVVRADLTHPRLRGKVVSRAGVPLPGVRIVPGLIIHKTEWGNAWESGDAATTNQAGVFEFADFPRSHVHLDVRGQTVVPERFDIGTEQDVENLTFMVAQRCHFRIEVLGEDLAGLAIEMHDRNGNQLSIYSFSARMSSSSSHKPLEDGRAAVSAVSEDAVELLVFRDSKQPIVRQKITLSSEHVNELRVVLP